MIVLLSQLLWAVFLFLVLTWRRRPLAEDEAIESSSSRALHLLLVIAGFALMWLGHGTYQAKPAMMRSEMFTILGLLLLCVALSFGVWARITLGENWTSRVRTGAAQKLIVHGPYRMTRHPIYGAIIVGALGSALIVGRFRAYVGFVLILVAYLRKTRVEDKALELRFGDEYRKYEEYVPPLLPIKGMDAVKATDKDKKEKEKQKREEQENKAKQKAESQKDQTKGDQKKSA